jgi:D-glycerate 3-kinase
MVVESANNKSWIDELCRGERLPDSYTAMVLEYVAPLAERIQALHTFLGRPIVIGINGAQGSGKSTLALFLMNWLKHEHGISSASLSLDDLYLGKQARKDLAEHCHPLLRTRGVPGTHDVALGIKILDALTEQGPGRIVKMPVFDKATDDLLRQSEWRNVEVPVDVVLFEGWCVGARPQSDECLNSPVNSLEAKDDPGGVWRTFVNEKLSGDYVKLFERLDVLIMLRVPSFDNVFAWRELQERKQRADTSISADELRHFIMHFERLTRHMLEHMPEYADTVIDIDESHRIVDMVNTKWAFERGSS